MLQDARRDAIVNKALLEPHQEQPASESMKLVPTEETQPDVGEELRKLQDLADAPVTAPAFSPGAVSPTIAGTPGPHLSGVLANTEGLSAFEQIIKLREVR